MSRPSSAPALSADGRYVLFSSRAANLVASDTNGSVSDVFVRDRQLGTVQLVSLDSAGQQGTDDALAGDISADGRYVAFIANALAPSDSDAAPDVYVRDRQSGTTQVLTPVGSNSLRYSNVSISANGQRVAYRGFDANGNATRAAMVDHVLGLTWAWTGFAPGFPANSSVCSAPVLSGDGDHLFFAFEQHGSTGWSQQVVRRFYVPHAVESWLLMNQYTTPRATSHDGRWLVCSRQDGDLFVLDVPIGEIDSLTPTIDGLAPNGEVLNVSLSDDGRYVAFSSTSSNLVVGDTNGTSDVFIRDRLSRVTLRASESAGGLQSNGGSHGIDFASDASLLVFDSTASNLVLGDTNAVSDVFARVNCAPHFADTDGDSYGATGVAQNVCLPAVGFSLNGLDCDDTNAARHPGVPDLWDGFDEDCDGPIDEDLAGAAYCTAGTSYFGCVPTMSGSGVPSVSATSGYSVIALGIPAQRFGMLIYGLTPAALPWEGGPTWTCIAAPGQRTGMAWSGGSLPHQCDGQFSLDVLAWAAANPVSVGSPLLAGQTRYFQAWYRNKPAPGKSGYSGGWLVRFAP